MLKRFVLRPVIILLVSVLFVNFASAQEMSGYIYNGQIIDARKVPIAKIMFKGRFICTGSLITHKHILTAAHCVKKNVKKYVIKVQGKSFRVRIIRRHPRYRGLTDRNRYDVAIFVLQKKANLKVLPLLTSYQVSRGDILNLYGYGKDEWWYPGKPSKLRWGVTKINNWDQFHIESYYTGYNQSNICSGDSGGPAIVMLTDGRYGIVGVNSFGYKPNNIPGGDICSPFSYSYFANVQGAAYKFIKKYAPAIIEY